MHLKNKIAVVTGGNSGIGLATVQELIKEGATVIFTGRRKEVVAQVAREVGAVPFVADQADINDILKLRRFVEEEFGRIDILFINAGITGKPSFIEAASEDNFDEVMNINFRGAYFTLSKLAPLLSESASVIFLSSNTAVMHSAENSIYQASKAALNSIAKTAAAEFAAKGIRVNTISPGPTKTNVLNSFYGQGKADEIWEHLTNIVPLKRIGMPEDVAKMVVYLSGKDAAYITGADFLMDGGMTL